MLNKISNGIIYAFIYSGMKSVGIKTLALIILAIIVNSCNDKEKSLKEMSQIISETNEQNPDNWACVHASSGEKPPRLKVRDVNVHKLYNFKPHLGEKGYITYTIDEPGYVSIRLVRRGTRELFIASIVNYAFRDSGTHTEEWNGKDYSGQIVEDIDSLLVWILAEPAKSYKPGSVSLNEPIDDIIHGHSSGHYHGSHHQFAQEVPYLKILQPENFDTVSGIVEIIAQVDEEKRGYGNIYGYGVRYYIDAVLINEEFYKPESNGRFSYKFDTTPYDNGKHTLYVGMCDHFQHTTSSKVVIYINN